MQASSVELRLRVQLLLAYGAIGLTALILGAFLATDQFLVAFMVGGALMMATLPFHAQLSFRVAVATFSSALVVPFLPGQPTWWEAAGLIGWSGVVVSVLLRKQQKDAGLTLRRNKLVVIGLAVYAVALVTIMLARGTALSIFGGAGAGGRFYFEQLIAGIFPILFGVVVADERTVYRLWILQWILATTYLISDFALISGGMDFVLGILKLSTDSYFFELSAGSFGIRRIQSLSHVAVAANFILLSVKPIKAYFTSSGLWMIPFSATTIGLGLLSGHRFTLLYLGLCVVGIAIAQKAFTTRNVFLVTLVMIPLIAGAYLFAPSLPLAAQRAISPLPGINVQQQARLDATLTVTARRLVRDIGINLIPDYLWLGRGFQRHLDFTAGREHPALATINGMIAQGQYGSGPVGLLLKTGMLGTLGFSLFLTGGTMAAWRLIRMLRRHQYQDRFALCCSVVAAVWFAILIYFVFFTGEIEHAFKVFSFQGGLVILCERLLRNREERLIESV